MSRTDELERQVQRLTSTIEQMQARMASLEAGSPGATEGKRPSTRRGFLRLGAAAAVGAIGVAASKVLPASAATAGNFVLGQANLAESPTTVQADATIASGQVLAAEDQSFVPADLATAGGFAGTLQGLGAHTGIVEGVDGWAQGPQAFGVYGLTDSGTGVVGESNTGIALHARRSGRILQDPLAAPPVYAANDFEQVRDPNGQLWISMPGGTWKQVATTDQGIHLFPDPRRIWDGWVQPQGPGVYGPIDATVKVPSQGGGPSGVPVGAQGAWCAVQSYNAGYMTIFPDLTTEPIITNWSSALNGPLTILYMFVPLSPAGKFKFHANFTGRKFYDVWGYLL